MLIQAELLTTITDDLVSGTCKPAVRFSPLKDKYLLLKSLFSKEKHIKNNVFYRYFLILLGIEARRVGR